MNKIREIVIKAVCPRCSGYLECKMLERCATINKAESTLTALIKSIVPTEEEICKKMINCQCVEDCDITITEQITCLQCQAQAIRKLQEQKIEEVLK